MPREIKYTSLQYRTYKIVMGKFKIPLCLLISLSLLFSVPGCAISPQPFTTDELQEHAKKDLQEIFTNQEPLPAQVSLYDAMARAIKYNLNHKVKLYENALAKGALVQSRTDLLPQLVASAGYTTRNNENLSFSDNIITGTRTSYSNLAISEEKDNFTSDLIFVWNILDFGVGYNKAKQQADEVLISEEHRRKAAQNIAQDIRYAFWRAVSAEKLLPKMDSFLKHVELALQSSRQMEKAQVDKPIKILDYQRELLETVQLLWDMRRNLALAKTELSTLMNLKPGAKYILEIPRQSKLNYPEFSLELLEEFALTQRPELRTEAYNQRIGTLEVRKAMLRMLPGLEFSAGASYDSNTYLYNSNWLHAGLNLSWNVFNILHSRTAQENAEMQIELARQRHMAASMMVISQVNIAKQQFHLSMKEYQIVAQLDEVHRRKLWHTDAAKKTKTGTELEEIRNKLYALSAEMQLGVAFAEVQGAVGNIYNSIGFDPMPEKIHADNLATLAGIMETHDHKLISVFAKKDSAPYTIQNPFHLNPIMDLSRNFIKSSIDDSSKDKESSITIGGVGQQSAIPLQYTAYPGASIRERKTFKRRRPSDQGVIATSTSPQAEESTDEQVIISLKQNQGSLEFYSRPPTLLGYEEPTSTQTFRFPASNKVKKLLADLKKSESAQLNKLAEQLALPNSRGTYKPIVTLDGTLYTVSDSREGKVMTGSTLANPLPSPAVQTKQ